MLKAKPQATRKRNVLYHRCHSRKTKDWASHKYLTAMADSSQVLAVLQCFTFSVFLSLALKLLSMASGRLILFCVIALCHHWVFADGCRWTQFQLGSKNEESVLLLTKMGGLFPLACLKEKGARLFPQDVYKAALSADAAEVALEALGYVDEIFQRDQSKVRSTWNADQLDLFRNILHRQIQKLQECVSLKPIGCFSFQVGSKSSSNENAALKSYFQKLNGLLVEKDLSACAWEIVRDEVHYSLVQLHAFLESRRT
ncbi:hypothetical protein ACEWY4_002311 [Coilia grayii]|uniref:Uncharacterized protein n=1 Tax=Coilia grayii TaxID=363190 RepID=A0ABD1KN36_9TELE